MPVIDPVHYFGKLVAHVEIELGLGQPNHQSHEPRGRSKYNRALCDRNSLDIDADTALFMLSSSVLGH